MATTSILPVETIEVEILPRLTVKSLLRFKSVCKSWNSLISSDVFMKSFRNSDSDSVTLLSYKRKVKCGRDNDEDYLYQYFIIGCINGLVFIEESHMKLGTVGFTIWNPATKQCLEIEPPPSQAEYDDHEYFPGFGFDSVANDYKLMHVIIDDIEEHLLKGYIYSCKAGSWSTITHFNFIVPGFIDNIVDPVIVHGSPFWLITQDHDAKRINPVVMSFDVRQEFFRLLPDLGSSGSITNDKLEEYYKLLNFRDSLAVMSYSSKLWLGKTIDIHIFNEKCDDWSKTSLGPFNFLSKVPTSCIKPWFLRCLSHGDILLVGSEVKELYWFDLENYTIKSLGNRWELYNDISYGYTYSESFVFIKGMKPFYKDEDQFRFLHLKRAAREEMQVNKYVKEKRKRKRSERSPEERRRSCKRRNANDYLCKRKERKKKQQEK